MDGSLSFPEVLYVTSVTSAIGGNSLCIFLQVPRRPGMSPRTPPTAFTCRVCLSCCWSSAVCKGLHSVPLLPSPAFCSCLPPPPPILPGARVPLLLSLVLSLEVSALSCLASLLRSLCFTQQSLCARCPAFRRQCWVQHPGPSGIQFPVGNTDGKLKIFTPLHRCQPRNVPEHFRSPFICL